MSILSDVQGLFKEGTQRVSTRYGLKFPSHRGHIVFQQKKPSDGKYQGYQLKCFAETLSPKKRVMWVPVFTVDLSNHSKSPSSLLQTTLKVAEDYYFKDVVVSQKSQEDFERFCAEEGLKF